MLRGSQDLFYCPSQDLRCEWKDGNLPPGTPRATRSHVPFGYIEGEGLLPSFFGTFFSYGYNMWGSEGSDSVLDGNHRRINRGLGFSVNPLAHDKTIEVGAYSELPAKFVRKPSLMIAIADTEADGWSDLSIVPARKHMISIPNFPNPVSRAPGKIHSGGANVLFCDGHVTWHLQSDLTNVDLTTVAGKQVCRMWNNDHRVDRSMP